MLWTTDYTNISCAVCVIMSQYYVLVVNLYRHYTVTVYDSNKMPDSSIASHLTLQIITQSVILMTVLPKM